MFTKILKRPGLAIVLSIVIVFLGVGACFLFAIFVFIVVIVTFVVVGLLVRVLNDLFVLVLDLVWRRRGQGLELAQVNRRRGPIRDCLAARTAFDLEFAGLPIDFAFGFDMPVV